MARAAEQAPAAAAPVHSAPRPSPAPSAAERDSAASESATVRKGNWPLLRSTGLLGITMAVVTAAGMAYHTGTLHAPHHVSSHAPPGLTGTVKASIPAAGNTSAREGPQQSPEAESEPAAYQPIRLANPFDASEIFEFPAGTSLAEARQSVAALLLERAHDRLDHFQQYPRAAPERAAHARLAKSPSGTHRSARE